jgi:hypothetical protein
VAGTLGCSRSPSCCRRSSSLSSSTTAPRARASAWRCACLRATADLPNSLNVGSSVLPRLRRASRFAAPAPWSVPADVHHRHRARPRPLERSARLGCRQPAPARSGRARGRSRCPAVRPPVRVQGRRRSVRVVRRRRDRRRPDPRRRARPPGRRSGARRGAAPRLAASLAAWEAPATRSPHGSALRLLARLNVCSARLTSAASIDSPRARRRSSSARAELASCAARPASSRSVSSTDSGDQARIGGAEFGEPRRCLADWRREDRACGVHGASVPPAMRDLDYFYRRM